MLISLCGGNFFGDKRYPWDAAPRVNRERCKEMRGGGRQEGGLCRRCGEDMAVHYTDEEVQALYQLQVTPPPFTC